MFDIGNFGASFRGGPLNGFDAMVMSECEKQISKPSKGEINVMINFLIFNGYVMPEDLEHFSEDEIVEMYNYYR